ncbi:hypothetical protein, partial [Photobacterium angustum]|uniref:hypothetical protein n=1 Tax=Photobacterium angustum TaxID=661 RepID=UPI0005E7202A
MDISDSHVIGGTVSSGYDFSNIIQNGKNTMTIIFTGVDQNNLKKLEQDAYCTLLIKEKRNGEIVNYSSLVGDALDGLASGKNSPHYDGLGQTAKVNEGYWEKNNAAYKVTRTFTVSGVKEWTWTKGKVITDNGKNRDLLYKQYMMMYKMVK